jgi:transposase InsO family protein
MPVIDRQIDANGRAIQAASMGQRVAVMTNEFLLRCTYRHRFETQQHAMRAIGDWIQFYNHRRPHQALGMRTPAEAYALAAWPVQERRAITRLRTSAALAS